MWNTCAASPKDTSTASQLGRRRILRRPLRRAGEPPMVGASHEEVEQRRLLAATGDEHVAARAEPGQQRLGHERRQHRPDRRVDRVAAFAQHPRARLRGQRMPGGDDSLFSLRPFT